MKCLPPFVQPQSFDTLTFPASPTSITFKGRVYGESCACQFIPSTREVAHVNCNELLHHKTTGEPPTGETIPHRRVSAFENINQTLVGVRLITEGN
ncbi:hypothetical protein Trydic_g5022 [Trypoxylus dichotomus]